MSVETAARRKAYVSVATLKLLESRSKLDYLDQRIEAGSEAHVVRNDILVSRTKQQAQALLETMGAQLACLGTHLPEDSWQASRRAFEDASDGFSRSILNLVQRIRQ